MFTEEELIEIYKSERFRTDVANDLQSHLYLLTDLPVENTTLLDVTFIGALLEASHDSFPNLINIRPPLERVLVWLLADRSVANQTNGQQGSSKSNLPEVVQLEMKNAIDELDQAVSTLQIQMKEAVDQWTNHTEEGAGMKKVLFELADAITSTRQQIRVDLEEMAEDSDFRKEVLERQNAIYEALKTVLPMYAGVVEASCKLYQEKRTEIVKPYETLLCASTLEALARNHPVLPITPMDLGMGDIVVQAITECNKVLVSLGIDVPLTGQ